jgi:ubiquitin-protein ligase
MSISAKKRIMKEIGMMQRPENIKSLNECGIYYQFNDDNFHNVKAMMMGPKDTPYSYGYYFFDINFPPKYPIDPPKVKFISLSRIRMNPNMYVCGKLCLSMINTWSGPSWTACMSLSQVLVATQSLLNEHPIQNEPGYDNEKGTRSINYNKVVSYANLKYHIVNAILNIPPTFEMFEDIMLENFQKNYQNIMEYMNNNEGLDNQSHSSQIYGLGIHYNFQHIKNSIDTIKSKYSSKLSDSESLSSTPVATSEVATLEVAAAAAPPGEVEFGAGLVAAISVSGIPNPNSIITATLGPTTVTIMLPKKKPSAAANSFEVGHQLTSEHDNRVYEVKLCQGAKRSFKRWVLAKVPN